MFCGRFLTRKKNNCLLFSYFRHLKKHKKRLLLTKRIEQHALQGFY